MTHLNNPLKYLNDLYKNELLAHLGLRLSDDGDWPLFISKPILCVMCQMLALRFNTDQSSLRSEIQLIWRLFLHSIKAKIVKRVTDAVTTGKNPATQTVRMCVFGYLCF